MMFVIILCLKNGLVFKMLASGWGINRLGCFCTIHTQVCFWLLVLCCVIVNFFPHSSIFYFYLFYSFFCFLRFFLETVLITSPLGWERNRFWEFYFCIPLVSLSSSYSVFLPPPLPIVFMFVTWFL